MTFKIITAVAICLSLVGCGSGNSSSASSPTPATPTPVPTSGNYVHIQISPGASTICGNANIPCVSVTVCEPANPSNCDTVDHILVDTGSYGLRVFRSLLPKTKDSLVTMQSGGLDIAECVGYADGTKNWGPVQYANIRLNNTTTTESIPIQVLDASFTGAQAKCPGADEIPSQLGLNGILGVGPFPTDEGVSNYYACNTSTNTCTTNAIIPPAYITNPITKFPPGENNGIALVFGSVPQSGVINADGYGIFGVSSANSNTPGADGNPYHVFQIESSSWLPINITSIFQGVENTSFLDSGSNFLYFGTSFLEECSYHTSFFCPSSDMSETAIMVGNNGRGDTSEASILFTIGNADSLVGTGNTAFSNIGAVFPGIGGIDWGLPFYLGKTVYTVFAGESVTINGYTYPASPNGYWIY